MFRQGVFLLGNIRCFQASAKKRVDGKLHFDFAGGGHYSPEGNYGTAGRKRKPETRMPNQIRNPNVENGLRFWFRSFWLDSPFGFPISGFA
jgi:hypothetical protein